MVALTQILDLLISRCNIMLLAFRSLSAFRFIYLLWFPEIHLVIIIQITKRR